jgi:archaemetzincin
MPKVTKQRITWANGFKLPSREETNNAVNHREPHIASLSKFFDPIPKPSHIDDWLAQYPTNPQSYNSWLSRRYRCKEDDSKNVIYLVWLSESESELSDTKLLNAIREYVAAFYTGIEVKFLPELKISSKRKNYYLSDEYKLESRVAHPYDMHKVCGDERQFQVSPILSYLKNVERPKHNDALCLLCLTMVDLYEGDTDSFVAGYASGKVGVFSFARYDPNFRIESVDSDSEEDDSDTKVFIDNNEWTSNELLLLQRGCKIAVHELGHMFNIAHCVYYSCCMNGSGHLEEDFKQSIHLCPVDLCKVAHETKCNVATMYRALDSFFAKYHMNPEHEWTSRVIKHLETNKFEVVDEVIVLD